MSDPQELNRQRGMVRMNKIINRLKERDEVHKVIVAVEKAVREGINPAERYSALWQLCALGYSVGVLDAALSIRNEKK